MAKPSPIPPAPADPRITKRKVTMTSYLVGFDAEGERIVLKREAVDYVREDFLEAYVADARTRWETVEVADGYDAGPGGYDGATHVPQELEHPLRGQTFPANTPEV